MDDIDRKILQFVQRKGEASLAEIGKEADLSQSATNERIRKLEAAGAIRGWQAVVSPDAAGCPVLAFAALRTRAGKDEDAFRKWVRRNPAVLECHQTTGPWTWLLKLRLPDLPALAACMDELRALPGVSQMETTLAAATHKESSILPIHAGKAED
jgi:Lrp/AsnC family leucine-responsive transcriptional regulator